MAHPRFNDVLANATNNDLLSLSDEDAIFIYEFDPGVNGTRLTGEYLLSLFVGWDPNDVFYSEAQDVRHPGTLSKKAQREEANTKPPLSDDQLERWFAWWSADPRNVDFTWPALEAALKAAFPNHHITRKRWKALSPEPRNPGRRPKN